ncbi:protein DsrB [Pantoea sp. Nvir]|uniref:protein DsrB n=1 Tax=Pantoea sp. Nvir TaxID=2576760 RepID=UPI001358B59B|nr:protein DsrB [Pantoea sp. Nvir]MXP66651.1 protein DsrB [Pantoea sp. Nvir]CAJ0991945.1 Protein DsrB [Pantoea sp. Nvir]
MKINDRVTIRTRSSLKRIGIILAIEHFNGSIMYLVALEDYPLGIWFFNESHHPEGIWINAYTN